MDSNIEDAFQLLNNFDRNRGIILKLLKNNCSQHIILSGIFGNYTGVKEIFRALTLQSQILPFASIKILKKTSYKNVYRYDGLFEMVHIGQLKKEQRILNLLNPKTSNYELLNFFIHTTPLGKKIEIHPEITYVIQKGEIVFINVNADPLEIVRQIEPHQIQEKVFALAPSVFQLIQTIQSRFDEKLSPMEIQCLAFSLCSFSSKQTASHLFLSHRTIESYLQSAHIKVGCRFKRDCLEMMYKNGLILEFQQLCYQLMQHPESICRSS